MAWCRLFAHVLVRFLVLGDRDEAHDEAKAVPVQLQKGVGERLAGSGSLRCDVLHIRCGYHGHDGVKDVPQEVEEGDRSLEEKRKDFLPDVSNRGE